MKTHGKILIPVLTIVLGLTLASFGCSKGLKGHEHPGEHPGEEHGGEPAKEHGGEPAKERGEKPAKEHGGEPTKEQGGKPAKEHGGQPAGKEHGGDEARNYNATQIKQAMKSHIEENVRKNGGIFKIKDKDDQNTELTLNFVKIHDPVRAIKGKGYFACTDFEVVGNKGKLYDIDFWLNPREGKLVVTEEKVHKDPIRVEKKWEKKARYTFINDNPVPIQ